MNKRQCIRCLLTPLAHRCPFLRTKETFVDGWVKTGDEVIIKGSQVYIVDRIKVREQSSVSVLIESHALASAGDNQGIYSL
jgi:acyl-CoA synthetase (AMP-forming)/AMP-acid ligase II